MKAVASITATALAVGALGGCAMWDSMGFSHRHDAPVSADVQATCEAAVATLRGGPDHDIALDACLNEHRRRRDKH